MKFIRYTGQIHNEIDVHGRFMLDSNDVEIITAPWERYKNPMVRKICHIHLSSSVNSRVSLPFKKIWIK
ncbi:MAG: hypothetical protein K6B64_06255, partial [Acholeplasmatales bacterium]|nr:hypothetical protein [Acholeplasmatales bacterium]